jgi:hypothetical protein
LKQQKLLKHDRYPKTIANASRDLNCHKFDNLGRKAGEKNKDNIEKSKSKKITQTYQNYHLLRWKGDVTAVVIHFQNAMTSICTML